MSAKRVRHLVKVSLLMFLIGLPSIEGQKPSLTSNVSPSGGLCQNNVTFLCTALGVEDGTFSWFLNRNAVGSRVYGPGDIYPFTVNSSIADFFIQMMNVTITNGRLFNFINFTLTIQLMKISNYVGENITCGQTLIQSSQITISSYHLQAPQAPNADNIIVKSTYQNQYLSRITIKWSIPTELCPNVVYLYTVVLLINGSNIVDSMNTSCSRADTNCQVIFELSSNSMNIYDSRIEALNDQGVVVSTTSIPKPIDGFSSVNPNITVDFRACTVKCYSSFTNGACEVQYIQDLLQGSVNGTVGSEIIAPTLQPGMILFNATFEIGEEIYNLRQNSTIIRYDVKWSGEILACTIIAVFFIILSLILIILIVIVLYTKWEKSESLRLKVIGITVFSAFLLLVSFIIWIAGLVEVGKLDNCENRNIPNGLLIAALVISIFNFLLDLLIAIVLVYMVNKCCSCNVAEEKSKELKLLEYHGAKSLDINEKGISNAEANVVHAHRKIQESREDAQIRTQTEITNAVVKTKETNSNIYNTTEQVGRGPNQPAAPHGSSEYSRLERENNSGANDSAKLQEEQYLSLDHKIPGTSDRPLVNTNATIATTCGTAEAGDQYGKLNGDQVKSTGLLGRLLRRSAPEAEEVLHVSTEGDHSGSTQGRHGGSTALSQSKSSQGHRGGLTQGHHGGSTQGDHGGSTQGHGGSTQGRGGSTQGRGLTQGRGGSTQGHGGSTQGCGGSTQGRGGSTQGRGGSTQGRGGSTQEHRGGSTQEHRGGSTAVSQSVATEGRGSSRAQK